MGAHCNPLSHLSQVDTLKKIGRSELVGRVDAATMRMVEEGIALVSDLPTAH